MLLQVGLVVVKSSNSQWILIFNHIMILLLWRSVLGNWTFHHEDIRKLLIKDIIVTSCFFCSDFGLGEVASYSLLISLFLFTLILDVDIVDVRPLSWKCCWVRAPSSTFLPVTILRFLASNSPPGIVSASEFSEVLNGCWLVLLCVSTKALIDDVKRDLCIFVLHNSLLIQMRLLAIGSKSMLRKSKIVRLF